nr:translation initiation factor IF-2-like [Oryctolagus cuniculus]
MGIGYRLQIQFITRKHRSGGGRILPAGRPQAEAPSPQARPARGEGPRPPLEGRASPGRPRRRLLPAPSFLPLGAAADRFSPPPRGLLLTLRKTPDVRGWLSATGGSGFPASPALPAASAPLLAGPWSSRLPRAPQTRGARRPLSSRENIPPASQSRERGQSFLGGKFWVSPAPSWPLAGTRGRQRWLPSRRLPPRTRPPRLQTPRRTARPGAAHGGCLRRSRRARGPAPGSPRGGRCPVGREPRRRRAGREGVSATAPAGRGFRVVTTKR